MVIFDINYTAKGQSITLFILGTQHNFSNFYNYITVKIIYTHNLYYHYYYLIELLLELNIYSIASYDLTKFIQYLFKTCCLYKPQGGPRMGLQLAPALLCKKLFYK